MAQGLRALAALAEGPSSVPGTHARQLPTSVTQLQGLQCTSSASLVPAVMHPHSPSLGDSRQGLPTLSPIPALRCFYFLSRAAHQEPRLHSFVCVTVDVGRLFSKWMQLSR